MKLIFATKKTDAKTVKNIKIEFYSSLICGSFHMPFGNLTKLRKILSNNNKQKKEKVGKNSKSLNETSVKKFAPAIRFGMV